MKIGILTFHCAHNYGAVLQCYALQEYLKSLGHDVYVIDYRPKYLTGFRGYRPFSPGLLWRKNVMKLPSHIRMELRLYGNRQRRYRVFRDFIAHRLRLYPYSSKISDQDFDCCIYGSDQIWSAQICGGNLDPVFLGQGVNTRRIAYAGSNRLHDFSDKDNKELIDALKYFDAISVREHDFELYLKRKSQLDLTTVLDPTLIVGANCFADIAKVPQEKDFIFMYEMGSDSELGTMAYNLADKMKLPVIQVVSDLYRDSNKINSKVLSVEEFLGYIKYAKCIVTNSFHGTALSIILEKTFYSKRQNTSADGRIENLLSQAGLMSRFVENGAELNLMDIDYSVVHKKLNPVIEYSRNWLKENV